MQKFTHAANFLLQTHHIKMFSVIFLIKIESTDHSHWTWTGQQQRKMLKQSRSGQEEFFFIKISLKRKCSRERLFCNFHWGKKNENWKIKVCQRTANFKNFSPLQTRLSRSTRTYENSNINFNSERE